MHIARTQMVAAALDSGQHAVVEAGTGVGKSLAYLVPAILSGKRVIISTARRYTGWPCIVKYRSASWLSRRYGCREPPAGMAIKSAPRTFWA